VVETPGSRNVSIAINETNAGFADKVPLQLIDDPKILQERIAKRKKGFPDVLARKFLPLQEQDLMTCPGKPCGSGGTGRSASDDNNVVRISF
jgi:hypothetical protein